MLTSPQTLLERLDDPDLLIVDVGSEARYAAHHLPGAVHLPYEALIRVALPATGLVPPPTALGEALGRIGIDAAREVVAYDAEGGGRAARLLWTLDWLGHRRHSLLNGGLQAWQEAALPTSQGRSRSTAPPRDYRPAAVRSDALADSHWVRTHLDDPQVRLVDTRSWEEYSGEESLSERAGHIPGAVHFDWNRLKDPQRPPALRCADTLREDFQACGITPEHEVVVYCQSHHRSSLCYVALRHLDYPRVRAYAGSWSEWGNDPALPIRTHNEPS